MFTDSQTIGIILTVMGLFFTFLGVVLFFDAVLIAMGNMLFLGGMLFLIGFQKTLIFFCQPRNWKSSVCFLLGICLVIFGFSFFGLCLEMYGFVKLFGGFFPYVVSTLRHIPIIGQLLNVPPFKQVADYIIKEGDGLPV